MGKNKAKTKKMEFSIKDIAGFALMDTDSCIDETAAQIKSLKGVFYGNKNVLSTLEAHMEMLVRYRKRILGINTDMEDSDIRRLEDECMEMRKVSKSTEKALRLAVSLSIPKFFWISILSLCNKDVIEVIPKLSETNQITDIQFVYADKDSKVHVIYVPVLAPHCRFEYTVDKNKEGFVFLNRVRGKKNDPVAVYRMLYKPGVSAGQYIFRNYDYCPRIREEIKNG